MLSREEIGQLLPEFVGLYLPYALKQKYPNENRKLGWQWVFPARQVSVDPVSGVRQRHHVCDSFFANTLSRALKRTKIVKNAVPHSLRQVYS